MPKLAIKFGAVGRLCDRDNKVTTGLLSSTSLDLSSG
jgi:hypothetical protein